MPNKYRQGKAEEQVNNTLEWANDAVDTTNFIWQSEGENDNPSISEEEKPVETKKENLQEEKAEEIEKVVVNENESYVNQLDVEKELEGLDEMERVQQGLQDLAKELANTIATNFDKVTTQSVEKENKDDIGEYPKIRNIIQIQSYTKN